MSKDKHQKQAEASEADALREMESGTHREMESGIGTEKEEVNTDSKENKSELEALKKDLEEKTKQSADYLDKLQRAAAEFDNFKKRTAKEKEALYVDAVSDVVSSFIPAMDNLERALAAITGDGSAQNLKEGVEMVFRQFKEALKNIGVEEIKSVNEQFNPNFHNAVMHVEDEAYGANTVIEEFQKGYAYKEKVIRYSMVKVAN